MNQPIRVLIIDDHRLFSDGLELLLSGDGSIEIVASVHSAEEALERWASAPVDVVLMDIDLPGMDGIEATRRLRETNPEAQVVIITAMQQADVIARAIEAGASGYVPKTHAADDLVNTIKQAAAGEIVVPAGALMRTLTKLEEAQRARRHVGTLVEQLTKREVEVLQAISDGRSTAEIADIMGVSPLTVRTHVRSLLAKMGVHSRLEAAVLALRQGVIQPAHASR